MLKKIIIITIFCCFNISVNAGEITVQKLPNGQTLVVKEVKDNPIVTIDTWVKTGSIDETDSNSGVAHFLEHLFFKGTKKHPAGEFDQILEAKGAIINAGTSKDFTHYYITLPSQFFDIALNLHSDMLTNPQIPRKELEKERKVVLEEISKDLNTPSKKVYNNLNEMMYSHHPYKRKVIGSANVISTIRREEILDFFNNHYSPTQMITVIVGNINTDNVIEKVSKAFASDYKKPIKKCYKKELPLFTQKRKIEYTEAQAGYMMIGFRGASICENDIYALDLLEKILGNGKSSRLYKNVKDQKGLAYSISANNLNLKDDGIFFISANYSPSNIEKLEKSIFDEIKNIQKYGITEEELEVAKKIIEQDTYYSRETTSNISSEIGYIMTLTGSLDLYENYIENIKKVSLTDIKRVANKYLGINKSAVSIVLPKKTEITEAKARTQHYAQKVSNSNGIEKFTLDNNSTLLINNHNNNDIIAISIIAKGGQFLENRIGEGTLTAETMLKGTKKYSSQELAQLMEENGIKIKPQCGEDYFKIDLQTTTSQVDLSLEILNEILNYSLFEDYEIEKSRTEILNKIRQRKDVPMNIALDEFKTLIFENSVYSHSNNVLEKTLPQITKENVISYYNKIFDSKNVIISINGNVNKDTVINSFGEILKDKKQPKFNYSNYKITNLTKHKTSTKIINDLQTAWLFMGWQTSGVNNKNDYVTLKIINTILGGGISSRIYKNLREQEGLAYQLGSSYTPKMLGGSFLVYIGSNPSTIEYSKNKLLKEIERLKMEFVSDTELEYAKNRLKGGLILEMETNSKKASNIGLFETSGFGYDFLKEYVDMIEKVSASDIIRVANKYFNNVYIESTVKK